MRGKPINLILNIIRFALRPTSKDLYEKARHSIKVYVRNDQKAEFDVLRKKNPKMAILDIIRLMNPDQAHLKKIDDAQSVLKAIPTKTSAEAVKFIINSSLEIGQTGGLGDRERIYALLTICFLYPDLHELINAISEICSKFRKEPSVIEEEKEELTEQDDAEQFATPKAVPAKVILSTAHKAKGREFDHVIIIDALEPPAITSSTSDLERTDPEEERRLFYVAMTRAKHKLDILSVETYYGTNEIPSHFISDYANICETLTDQTIIQCEWPTLPSLTDESIAIPELKERVLYAVRKGNEIGIFYTDAERRKAVNGYSNPEQKKCYSMQEALQYLYPEGIPKDMRPLNTKTLSGILYLTSSSIINKKTDLPGWLNVALPRLASVNRLSQLSPHDIAVLHDSVSTLFKDDSETDYSGKGIPYALAYLPANVLKVWKPLWVMVQKQMLPHQLTILETGPGPGTATIGLITFYSMIAQDNPDITFSIKYHTVERQKDFVPVFSAMTHACLQSIPTNLHVEIIPLELKDAYIYMASISRPTYDIILESNMMNASEGLDSEKMIAWLHGIEAGLKPNGFLIQIEPGKTVDRYNLQRLAAALHQITQSYDQGLNAIDVSGFTFQREAEEAKLRYAHKTEHWFNWMLLRRT